MAKNSEIIIRHELRPCMVVLRVFEEEKRALFHCWNHANGYGVVELEDGTVTSVYPKRIRFLDRPFSDYCWNEEEVQE